MVEGVMWKVLSSGMSTKKPQFIEAAKSGFPLGTATPAATPRPTVRESARAGAVNARARTAVAAARPNRIEPPVDDFPGASFGHKALPREAPGAEIFAAVHPLVRAAARKNCPPGPPRRARRQPRLALQKSFPAYSG